MITYSDNLNVEKIRKTDTGVVATDVGVLIPFLL